MSDPVANAFTVDVEDYFHVSAFADGISPRSWTDFPARVETNTIRILDLLARYQVRATFFVLGWVAWRYPDLIRRIQLDGHEIASHGYWHRLIYSQTPDEFRFDLRQARDVLEQLTGCPVISYRAPSFSIIQNSIWALEILAEEGYQFDSSIYPVRHDRYGLAQSSRFPFGISCHAGTLWEFPPPVMQKWGMNVPVGGGGYLRLYPYQWTLRGLRNINEKSQQPFALYVHPWEFDPEQPRIRSLLRSQFRHYVNLSRTEPRISQLLQDFRFGTLTDSFLQMTERMAGSPQGVPPTYRFDHFHRTATRPPTPWNRWRVRRSSGTKGTA
jgi:polysaccharide deacetylase family protein (PEP-CTERM system associated)